MPSNRKNRKPPPNTLSRTKAITVHRVTRQAYKRRVVKIATDAKIACCCERAQTLFTFANSEVVCRNDPLHLRDHYVDIVLTTPHWHLLAQLHDLYGTDLDEDIRNEFSRYFGYYKFWTRSDKAKLYDSTHKRLNVDPLTLQSLRLKETNSDLTLRSDIAPLAQFFFNRRIDVRKTVHALMRPYDDFKLAGARGGRRKSNGGKETVGQYSPQLVRRIAQEQVKSLPLLRTQMPKHHQAFLKTMPNVVDVFAQQQTSTARDDAHESIVFADRIFVAEDTRGEMRGAAFVKSSPQCYSILFCQAFAEETQVRQQAIVTELLRAIEKEGKHDDKRFIFSDVIGDALKTVYTGQKYEPLEQSQVWRAVARALGLSVAGAAAVCIYNYGFRAWGALGLKLAAGVGVPLGIGAKKLVGDDVEWRGLNFVVAPLTATALSLERRVYQWVRGEERYVKCIAVDKWKAAVSMKCLIMKKQKRLATVRRRLSQRSKTRKRPAAKKIVG